MKVKDRMECIESEEKVNNRNENSHQEMLGNGYHHIMMSLKHHHIIIFVVALIMVIATTFTTIEIVELNSSSNSEVIAEADEIKETISPSQTPSTVYESSLNNILSTFLDNNDVLFHHGTNQWSARVWMTSEDPVKFAEFNNINTDLIIQRFVLLIIYFAFGGKSTSGIDWLSENECDSQLISCNDKGKVRSLLLGEFLMYYAT